VDVGEAVLEVLEGGQVDVDAGAGVEGGDVVGGFQGRW
jgi:hypothetical protein